ncbi:unnamed protein product [Prorocentrum cordatum]|uniref:Phosphoglycerate mutase (2,3-diphosphoglycerate-dependent) n=1 Tax=Prorocentrum cordatum TaxID=2364126 RepID=A0ABN9WP79_9DINO|nr:unnamed protein product [Polarella glacialis]
MKVLFIRHGEAEHNVAIAEARRLGHSVPEAMGAAALLDARLTAAGRAQAEALQERLAPLGVELVATSPLRRCLQTTRLAFGDAVRPPARPSPCWTRCGSATASSPASATAAARRCWRPWPAGGWPCARCPGRTPCGARTCTSQRARCWAVLGRCCSGSWAGTSGPSPS